MAVDIKPTDDAIKPGALMRMAREERGMSLDEAARITCIGLSYLEALESDRYEQLPNPAYVKGIIRSYARVLGIPPEPVIARYEESAEPWETADEQSVETALISGRKRWLPLLVIGGIILVGFLLAQRDSRRSQPPFPAEQTVTATLPAQGILPLRTSHSLPASSPALPAPVPARKEVRKDAAPVEAARMVVLKLKVVHDCILTMTIDDAPPQQYELKPGDYVEWMGERYFALEMTDAGAVEGELNGKHLPPLGKSGDAATVVITSEGEIQ